MTFSVKNRGLTSLIGIVPEGTIELDCAHNRLTSLEGCPSSVLKLNCAMNRLTSLKHCPKFVEVLDCYANRLFSLEGCPPFVKLLDCSHNRLISLQGCSSSVINLNCYNNQLTSLEWCPPTVVKLSCLVNPLLNQYRGKSIEEVHEINRVKRFMKGLDIIRKLILNKKVSYLQACWETYWYKPNEDEVARYAEYSYRLCFPDEAV